MLKLINSKQIKILNIVTAFIFAFYIFSYSAQCIIVHAVQKNEYDVIIKIGETYDLAANIEDMKGRIFEAGKIKWTSDNLNIASVNSAGTLSGVNEGTTYITAVDNEGAHIKQATIKVKVISIVESIKLYEDTKNTKEINTVNVYLGGKTKIKYRIYLKPMEDFKKVFGSEYENKRRKLYFQKLLNTYIDKSIADSRIIRGVNVQSCERDRIYSTRSRSVYSGVIEVLGGYEEGNTKVTLSTRDGDKKTTLNCNVKTAVNGVSIKVDEDYKNHKGKYKEAEKVFVCVGDIINIKAFVQSKYDISEEEYCTTVNWDIDDTNIVSISSGGNNILNIIGKQEGKSIITVSTKDGHYKDSIELYVISMVKGVEIRGKSTIDIPEGRKNYKIQYKLIPKKPDEIVREIRELMGKSSIGIYGNKSRYSHPFNTRITWNFTTDDVYDDEYDANIDAATINNSRSTATGELTGRLEIIPKERGIVKLAAVTDDGGYTAECIIRVDMEEEEVVEADGIELKEIKPANVTLQGRQINYLKRLSRKDIYCGDSIILQDGYEYTIFPKNADNKNIKVTGSIYSDEDKARRIGSIRFSRGIYDSESSDNHKSKENKEDVIWVFNPEHDGVYEINVETVDGRYIDSKDVVVKTMLKEVTVLANNLEKDDKGNFFIYQGQGIITNDKKGKRVGKPVYIGYKLSPADYIGDENIKLKDIRRWETNNSSVVRVSQTRIHENIVDLRKTIDAELFGIKSGEEAVVTAITRDNEIRGSIKVKVESMVDNIRFVDEKDVPLSKKGKVLKIGIGAEYEPKVKVTPKEDLAYGYKDVLDKEYSLKIIDEKVKKSFIMHEKGEIEKDKENISANKKELVKKEIKQINEKEAKIKEKQKYIFTLENSVLPEEVTTLEESIKEKDNDLKNVNSQLNKVIDVEEQEKLKNEKLYINDNKERLLNDLEKKKVINTNSIKEKIDTFDKEIRDINKQIKEIASELKAINAKYNNIKTKINEFENLLEKYKNDEYIPLKDSNGRYLRDRNGDVIKILELKGTDKITGKRIGKATLKVISKDGGLEDICSVIVDDKIEKMIIINGKGEEITQSRMPVFSDEDVIKKEYGQSVKSSTKQELSIKLDYVVDRSSVIYNQWAVYVTDSDYYEVKAKVRVDSKDSSGMTLTVTPEEEYKKGKYFIFVTKDVKFKGGKTLSKPIRISFKVD